MKICKPRQQKLCGKEECQICLKRSFTSYDGKTVKGTRKVELWNNEVLINFTNERFEYFIS